MGIKLVNTPLGEIVEMQEMEDGQLGEVVSEPYKGEIVHCYRGSLGHLIIPVGKQCGSGWSSRNTRKEAGSTNKVRLLSPGEMIQVTKSII